MESDISLTFTIAGVRYTQRIGRETALRVGCAAGVLSFQWMEGLLLVRPEKGILLREHHHVLYMHRVHAGERLFLNGTPIDIIDVQCRTRAVRSTAGVREELGILLGALFTTVAHMLV